MDTLGAGTVRDDLHVILASFGDGVVGVDTARRVTHLNSVAESLTGWMEREALGQPLDMIFQVSEERGRRLLDPVAEVLATGRVVGATNHKILIAKDGVERAIAESAMPTRDKSGHVVGAVLIFRDQTAERQVEEALRETRDYLNNLLEYANAPVIVWDPAFRITRFNRAFERLTGRSARETLGKTLDILFPADGREKAMAHIRHATAGERWETVEIPIVHVSGAVRTVLWNSASLFAEDESTVIATIAQGQDITERKRSEELLRQRVKELTCLQRISKTIHREGIRTMEILEESVCALSVSWLHPESTVARIRIGDEVRSTGDVALCVATQVAQIRVAGKNSGTVEVGYLDEQPEADEGPFLREERNLIDAVAGLLGNALTRFDHEQALMRERETLKTVIDAIDDGIYVADPESYEVIHVNATFKKMRGDNLVGKKCYEALRGKDAPCSFCTNNKIFGEPLGATYVWELEDEVTKDWYRCSDKAIRWIDGRMAHFQLASDITARKRAEETLKELNDNLARSNKELEQFAYVASHDLQEPLRMVASYTQLLSQRYQGQLDDKADKYIAYAVEGATRMQGLINDLLDFSRVGTRGEPLEPTDSGVVLAEILRGLETAITETSAEITVTDLPMVMADPIQLGQVFQNLIANAIKFRGEAPPKVEVTAKPQGESWEICVRDQGIGIEPQFHKRIFDVFQRLHARGKYSGSGIGLSIVKKIVERHGGRIEVESAAGEGTRFAFTIPAVGNRGAQEHA
ncbi:MAG: PAS domain S-box protein [Deltaproteobacteria bacterium]|nr:PAS domain S-box protein [Deltaproteobacteria bacterium]